MANIADSDNIPLLDAEEIVVVQNGCRKNIKVDELIKFVQYEATHGRNAFYNGTVGIADMPNATSGFWIANELGVYENFGGVENIWATGIISVDDNGDFYIKEYKTTEIVDNLNSLNEGVSLSANMGRVLNENLQELDERTQSKYNDTSETLAGDILERVDKFTKQKLTYKKSSVFNTSDIDGVLVASFKSEIYELVFDAVNVKWFGAKGDTDVNDIGTDDTQAIKEAISSLTNFISKQKANKKFSNVKNEVFLPLGKYKISETIILENNMRFVGDGLQNTVIHCVNSMIAITNVKGYEAGSGNIISSKKNLIENLTLSQGGIELIQPWLTTVENVCIENLFGVHNIGLYIEIPVGCKINNLQVRGSDGDGVVYRDFAGSGPSTTTFFTNLWVQHCNRGIVLDGNNGGSHELAATNFINTIVEYCNIGLYVHGKVNFCNFSTVHFEQNGRTADITDNCILSFDNVWDDTNSGFFFRPSANSNTAIVKLSNVNSNLQIAEGYEGTIHLSGRYRLEGFPTSCRLVFDSVQAVNSNSLTIKPIVGQTAFLTNFTAPVWWDGGTWRNANGFNVFTPKIGTSAERPTFTDDLFRYFNSDSKKWNTFFNGNWYDDAGNVV